MRVALILPLLILAGCCPGRIADGGEYGSCGVDELVALLGDPAPNSRSIQSAVANEAARSRYVAAPGEWSPWEERWLAALEVIRTRAAGTALADRAHLLAQTINQARTLPELREIAAAELPDLLAELAAALNP